MFLPSFGFIVINSLFLEVDVHDVRIQILDKFTHCVKNEGLTLSLATFTEEILNEKLYLMCFDCKGALCMIDPNLA